MSSLSVPAQSVGLVPVWRRIRRVGNRLMNRYMWRLILPISQMNRSKLQLILLLVLIPSILAGILVAEASQSQFASRALIHR